jgi:hypothetical protein
MDARFTRRLATLGLEATREINEMLRSFG